MGLPVDKTTFEDFVSVYIQSGCNLDHCKTSCGLDYDTTLIIFNSDEFKEKIQSFRNILYNDLKSNAIKSLVQVVESGGGSVKGFESAVQNDTYLREFFHIADAEDDNKEDNTKYLPKSTSEKQLNKIRKS